jgi:hypothetical protein
MTMMTLTIMIVSVIVLVIENAGYSGRRVPMPLLSARA